MRKVLIALVCLLIPPIAQAASDDIQINAKTHKFPNGLELVVVERHWSPTASFIIRFKVGGSDEHPGITGSAHLLEHMLFKGTKTMGTTDFGAEAPLMARIDTLAHLLKEAVNKTRGPLYRGDGKEVDSLKAAIAALQEQQKQYIIKDEFWETYLKNGGNSLNASTSNDGTQYFVSLPANRAELWSFMESDRMAGPILARVLLGARRCLRGTQASHRQQPRWQTLGAACGGGLHCPFIRLAGRRLGLRP